jgi:glycyl-tRNA synthetase
MDKVMALCKRRGFIFPGSELYGGLNGTFDYGPLGVALKRNIMEAWWSLFHTKKRQLGVVALDSGVLMARRVWEKSGHLANFADPMSDCVKCKKRTRADHLIERLDNTIACGTFEQTVQAAAALQAQGRWQCPYCDHSPLGAPRLFNLLFPTKLGPLSSEETFFRPETAQGVYVNMPNLFSARGAVKLPVGVAQMGKAFRNEINPSHFVFRTREFEQMELQWFCEKQDEDKWHAFWVEECLKFVCSPEFCNLDPTKVRVRHHAKADLAHYASACADLEYCFPFGWGELCGVANRGDWDLKAHNVLHAVFKDQQVSCIEPSMGASRLMLAMLCDAMGQEEDHLVLRLGKNMCPTQLAIMPVVNNKPEVLAKTAQVYDSLAQALISPRDLEHLELDLSSGSIGKKYAKHDEIGTLMCMTVDSDTCIDGSVSVRKRDSGERVRIRVDGVRSLDDVMIAAAR